MAWSSQQYRKFENERTRPARDLLQAVPAQEVKRAADLGCGPGNSTELIISSFPHAEVVGVDNSEDMIEAAKARLPGFKFELCGIEEWAGPGPWDLIFSSSALHWVPTRERLLPWLAGRLSPGGTLAIQMPDNLNEPSHVAMRAVAMREPFAAKLANAGKGRTPLASVDCYYGLLKPLSSRVDIWQTTYFHPLAGGLDAIVEWLKGTEMIPFLKPLSETERQAYVTAYKAALPNFYKPLANGTVLLPLPRLFIIVTR
jgi:trans-aconitate 2-methyltransferase